MTHRPTDLELTADKDIHLDQANDLAVVSGVKQLEQSVAMDVLDVTQRFVGRALTGENVGLLEARVEESLAADEQVGDVQTVTVTEYDRRTNSITMDVVCTEDQDFTIQISN